ncbi:MAG: restriction endonuclease subunit S, partial [Chloroflexia bacterium]|nr:restriction endonuclease subunit S [Chloroflexia bacterium]
MSDVALIEIESRQLSRKRLLWGDIIIERSGGGPRQPVGRVAFFDLQEGEYCFSNFTSRLRVVDRTVVEPEFLHAFLFYFHISGQTEMLQRRTTGIRNLSFEEYKATYIPLPPLAEQRAIAASLRAAQAAVQARRRTIELERERKAALMQALLTRGTHGEPTKMTEIGEVPQGWEVVPVRQVAEVAYGITVNQTRRAIERQVPLITVANVTRGMLNLDTLREIGVLPGDEERCRLKCGDVLVIEGNGNPKLLGSAAIWNDELPLALHQNHLIRVRADQEAVLPHWIMSYLNSDDGRGQLFGRSTTSSGLHSINSRLIAELKLPLPPLAEQREIAGQCERR